MPAQFSNTACLAGTVMGLRASARSAKDIEASKGEVAIPEKPEADIGRTSGRSPSETTWLYKILQGDRGREVGDAQRLMTWFRIPFHEVDRGRENGDLATSETTPVRNHAKD